MRRMITKNGIIDAVNEGIESGEIEVGGGLPEFSDADTGRVLTVIEDAETGDPVASWEDAGGSTVFEQIETPNVFIAGDEKATSFSNWNPPTSTDPNGCLIVDFTKSNYKVNSYTLTSSGNLKCSLALLGPKQANWKIPLLNNSIFVGNPPTSAVYQVSGDITGSIVIDPSFENNIQYATYVNSICAGKQITPNRGRINTSITLSEKSLGIPYQAGQIYNSLILISSDETVNTSLYSVRGTIINGDRNILTITNSSSLVGCYLGGTRNLINSSSSMTGVNVIGKYGSWTTADNANDVLVVGAGQSTSSRANCFATGNDGTDDYIKIGDTKITESQLQALLALLNQ